MYDKTTGRLTRLEADSDGDGKPDTWAYMDGPRVERVEADDNGDGTVDRWEYHTAGPAAPGSQARPPRIARPGRGVAATPDKTIDRIELATRHDGVVSRWEYFDNGLPSRVEEDTDGDGKVDKWETYTAGHISMMAIDLQRRGRPDRRLIYRPDGTLDRIEADPTGSGTFQPLAAQPAR